MLKKLTRVWENLKSLSHARLKLSPVSFFVTSILVMIDFHLFFRRIKLSGKAVSSAPESAGHFTRPSAKLSFQARWFLFSCAG
ncbi:MAG TPA: hypothetical protein VMD27_01995 [Candidatus Aquilonibacter sp.]|nr:hypothetical protein [Candidatus Aquilonibacter sp.]